MAFSDFDKYTPVIILGKDKYGVKDTDIEDVRKRTIIKNGASATPETFNNSIEDSLNRDQKLEQALQCLARSASMYTTSSTKFLSHCEGEGKDIISYKAPTSSTGSVKDIFISDDTFLGAAYPTGRAVNLIRESSGIDTTYPHKGISDFFQGWKLITDLQDINISITENVDGCTRISNVGCTKKAGVVKFKSKNFRVFVGSSTSTETIPTKISFGFTVTATNFFSTKTSVLGKLHFIDGDTGIEVSTAEELSLPITLNSTFSGVLYKEAINVPEYKPKSTTKISNLEAYIEILVNFPELGATQYDATIDLSHFMMQEGEILPPWVKTTRESSFCQYKNVINLNEKLSTSLMCWAKWSEYFILRKKTKPLGPIFLSFNDEYSLGLVCDAADTDNFYIKIGIYNGNSSPIYSNDKIVIPKKYFDTYLFQALRIMLDPEDVTKLKITGSIVLEDKVLSVEHSINITDIPLIENKFTLGDIVVGNAREINSLYNIVTDVFSSRITEIRYDQEWVNDIELFVISLGRKAFSYKQSTDSQITTTQKTATEIIDSAGVNLLPNPTGKADILSWTTYPATFVGFSAQHNNSELGNCFYASVANNSNDIIIYSPEICVTTNNLYHLRAVMYSDITAGEVGIGMRFYSGTFNPSDPTITDIKAGLTKESLTPKYYACQHTATPTESKARVYMYISKNTSAANIGWSKLKFEHSSSPTFFTDDTGPTYAIYA